MQEVGAPRNVLPEGSVVPFLERTVAELAGAPRLFGITWWCSHDVSRSLADFPELEYDLGLIDEHGRVKPAGLALRDAVAEARARRPALLETASPELILDLDAVGGRAALAPGGEFWKRYMQTARTAGHPRVVLADS